MGHLIRRSWCFYLCLSFSLKTSLFCPGPFSRERKVPLSSFVRQWLAVDDHVALGSVA